jgi:hypothetical protein
MGDILNSTQDVELINQDTGDKALVTVGGELRTISYGSSLEYLEISCTNTVSTSGSFSTDAKTISFINEGDSDAYFALDAPAVVGASNSVRIKKSESMSFDVPATSVHGITQTGSATLRVIGVI